MTFVHTRGKKSRVAAYHPCEVQTQRFDRRSTAEEVRRTGSLAALHGTAGHIARARPSLHTLGSMTGRTAG